MDTAPAPDPNDWRTWPREGTRLFPPPGTTPEQAFAGTHAFSLARWGVDPQRPRKSRRNVIRVLKKIDGRYQQVMFARSTPRALVNVRVYGGCRPNRPE
jgi:hypothetical protein